MFESDDFDQVLSQFDVPGCNLHLEKTAVLMPNLSQDVLLQHSKRQSSKSNENVINSSSNELKKEISKITVTAETQQSKSHHNLPGTPLSPKHMKRKLITSLFDHKNKRKFPGPAGLLTGKFEEDKDERLGQIELFSQDIDFSQNNLGSDIFESPLWMKLSTDVNAWNLGSSDSIKAIKERGLSGNLRHSKAQLVTAFVETVDRSGTDPLITLRDDSGTIKCTLHRDAWSYFSSYIAAEYCAFVLCRSTVLTRGGAFKKHYLNITLRNIFAIYSSAAIDKDIAIPDNYEIVSDSNITIIKNKAEPNGIGSNLNESNGDGFADDGLDSIFLDEIF